MSAQDPPNQAPREGMSEAAVRDHLANERTLLAWQRTALGVIAIGFLVDRFALSESGSSWLAPMVGVLLVASGALVSAIGAYRFLRIEREIDTQTYRPAVQAHMVLTAAVVAGAVVVAVLVLVSPSI